MGSAFTWNKEESLEAHTAFNKITPPNEDTMNFNERITKRKVINRDDKSSVVTWKTRRNLREPSENSWEKDSRCLLRRITTKLWTIWCGTSLFKRDFNVSASDLNAYIPWSEGHWQCFSWKPCLQKHRHKQSRGNTVCTFVFTSPKKNTDGNI